MYSILAVLLGPTPAGAADVHSQDRRADIATAEARLIPTVEAWGRRHATTVDPRLVRELAGELVHSESIFSYDYDKSPRQPIASIRNAFADDVWLSAVTHAHLDELSQSPQMIRSFFSRLAMAVGINSEKSGWPAIMVNGYLLHDLTNQLPNESLLLLSDGLPGRQYLHHRKFLVGAGQHTITSEGGRTWTFEVAVPDATLTAPADTESHSRVSDLRVAPPVVELSYIKAPIEHYCKNDPLENESGWRQDRSSGRHNEPRSPSPLFHAELLQVQYDIADSVCESDCRASLAQALIRSFALWRSGCARCEAEKLIAIAVNGSIWIDNVTVDKWRFALEAGGDTAIYDPKRIARMSLRPLGRQPVADFRRVDPRRDEALCEAGRRYAKSTDLRQAVCTGRTTGCNGPGCLSLPIRLGRAKGCELTGRIACGSPDGEIALNTTDYTFHSLREGHRDTHSVTFGGGDEAVDLFPVLLHETGHWFGLNHERELPQITMASIMRGYYDDKEPWCVTEWNLTQLDNAVDMEWDFRLMGSHGLVLRDE